MNGKITALPQDGFCLPWDSPAWVWKSSVSEFSLHTWGRWSTPSLRYWVSISWRRLRAQNYTAEAFSQDKRPTTQYGFYLLSLVYCLWCRRNPCWRSRDCCGFRSASFRWRQPQALSLPCWWTGIHTEIRAELGLLMPSTCSDVFSDRLSQDFCCFRARVNAGPWLRSPRLGLHWGFCGHWLTLVVKRS